MNAAIAYSDLRRALVAPDALSPTQLKVLAARAMQAADKYPEAPNTPAQNAENVVLRAYASYVIAVASELQCNTKCGENVAGT